jgi:hypothetical protein
MLYTSGIVAAVTVSFVIWFTIVVTSLGSAFWPLLACDNARGSYRQRKSFLAPEISFVTREVCHVRYGN